MRESTRGQVLITGVGGGLVRSIARRYLEMGDESLLLWLHARDAAEFRSKERELRAHLAPHGTNRFSCTWGDLRDPEPFAGIDTSAIVRIVHGAAVTRFNVERRIAERVNVAGTCKLLKFARSCPNLERVALLSSVYASGLRTGEVREQPLSRSRFANHYEWSKWSCEQLLLEHYRELPWQIFRIATAVADGPSGRVSHQNALHNTLKLFYYGLLSLVPGQGGTPLYFVTLDFAAEAIHALVGSGEKRTIYHVSHAERHSTTLEELISLAFERFERERDFRARRVLRPLFCDAETFDLLADGIDDFGGAFVNQGLKSVQPFARQLFAPKSVQNAKLVAAYEHYAAPNSRALIANTCDYLVRTRWGKRASHAA